DAELVVVRRVERRDTADALWAEARAGPGRGAGVERNADHRRVILADVVHGLDIGRLEGGVDAGGVRQVATRKRRNAFVGQAVGAREPHVQRPFLLLAPALLGQPPLGLDRLPALCRLSIEIWMMAALPRRRRPHAGALRISGALVKSHEAAPWGC